jgi:hypothetical protein
MWGRLLGQ